MQSTIRFDSNEGQVNKEAAASEQNLLFAPAGLKLVSCSQIYLSRGSFRQGNLPGGCAVSTCWHWSKEFAVVAVSNANKLSGTSAPN